MFYNFSKLAVKVVTLTFLNFSVLFLSSAIDIEQLLKDFQRIKLPVSYNPWVYYILISSLISIVVLNLIYFFKPFIDIYLMYYFKFSFYFLINLLSLSSIYIILRIYGYSRLYLLIYLFLSSSFLIVAEKLKI